MAGMSMQGDGADNAERFQRLVLGPLARVADAATSPHDVARQINNVVDRVLSHAREDAAAVQQPELFWEIVARSVRRCGLELSHKAAVYALVVALLSRNSTDQQAAETEASAPPLPSAESAALRRKLASDVVANVAASLQIALRDGQSSASRAALRFLAELCHARLVSPVWLTSTLRSLLAAAGDALSDERRRVPRSRGVFLADVAASTLPWAAAPLSAHAADADGDDSAEEGAAFRSLVREASNVLRRIGEGEPMWAQALRGYLSASDRWPLAEKSGDDDGRSPRNGGRATEEHMNDGGSGDGDDDVTRLCEYRPALLLDVLTELSGKPNGRTRAISRLASQLPVYVDALRSVEAVELRALQVPAHSRPSRYGAPRFHYRFAAGDAGAEAADDADAPEAGVADSFVLGEYADDILLGFRARHVDGASKLLTLPTPLDVNQAVVDATFSQLLSLPRAAQPAVYYAAVFVDLCRVRDSRLPLRLLSAVERVYATAHRLDAEVFDRLTEWFAVHLSNFGFKWNWSDWEPAAADAAAAASDVATARQTFQRLFCADVLAHASQLTYRSRIASVTPDALHALLPPEAPAGDDDAAALERRAGGDAELASCVEKLRPMITGAERKAPNELRARLIGIVGEGRELEQLRALFVAILLCGAKTLTHFDTILERYLSLLRELMAAAGADDARAVMSAEIEALRRRGDATLRALYYLDKLCAHGLLDGASAMNFLLDVSGRAPADERTRRKEANDDDDDMDGDDDDKSARARRQAERFQQSSLWRALRLLLDRQRNRLLLARQEVTTAARAASLATEGEAEEAARRLQSAKASVESSRAALQDMAMMVLRRLVEVDAFLRRHDDALGEDLKRVATWRVRGFAREVGRSFSDALSELGDAIDALATEAELTPGMRSSLQAVSTMAASATHAVVT